jgi:pimeloyl-ACP methyl ester carboxylesterase
MPAEFDPTPPGDAPAERRWWGCHLHELRWQAEAARLLVDPVFYGAGIPRGDGMGVLTIPGFLAGDASLLTLNAWLRRLGYVPARSGMAANVDCSDRAVARLERRLEALHARTGRPVALVGHSRGGHFVKALAARRPELVATAISVGAALDTPFDISLPTKAAVAAVRSVHHRLSAASASRGCFTDTCTCRFASDFAGTFPADVPLTSIYSRGDGVVWWEACVVPYARCIEVTGSHVGLATNRKVFRVIAETLAAAGSPPARRGSAPSAASPPGARRAA